MPVDLSEARFHSGLFTDGCIMLLEGDCWHRKLQIKGIGLPPIENSSTTRLRFGNENWFGGQSTVAYATVQKLRIECERNVHTKFIILSDVWLDQPRVLQGIRKILVGFAGSPPLAIILCGNFCSKIGTEDVYRLIKGGFQNLAEMIEEVIREHKMLEKTHFIFVPGPNDPLLNSVLPRSPLPSKLFDSMKSIPNCSFASNPCRIQYANQEIVIFRSDIIEKMCRNSIHMPPSTDDIAEHFCRTIASVGHLSPLPIHISPIAWQMDPYMMLYPLPDLVIIADQFQEFRHTLNGCQFTNPGSFSRTNLDFLLYYPATRDLEPSTVGE